MVSTMKNRSPKKHRHDSRPPRGSRSGSPGNPRRDAEQLRLQDFGGGRFAFVSPVCAIDRQEDIAEVREMIRAEEFDIANDELLYLVADCRGFLEAYNLLGELALEDNDLKLAKGHFGFGYETGLNLLPPGFRGTLPASLGDNRHFFATGRGLSRCLIALGSRNDGRDVLQRLAKLDPNDKPTQSLLAQVRNQEPQGGRGIALPVLSEDELESESS